MNFDKILEEEKQKKYFIDLMHFIESESSKKQIYPEQKNIFKALELTPFENVKVVLIGQDPYATPGFAMGLSFSVEKGIEIPKSLKNIFKEIHDELGTQIPSSGDLSQWAKKGVLLLNRILTVEKGKPLSHKNKGWEEFTLRILKELDKANQKIVFLLLGNEAKTLDEVLTNPNHLVLKTSHPSPLGAYRGFFGSGIFKETIEYLALDKTFWEIKE